ncbi:hypothetical protein DKX38_000442 [Salix brachista]|uniref:Pentatricopeptide repeat-containing protein n=1 Tax=Salix brachista TaxID=2182728 RepID=A0A5N5P2B3_9ROSI|nr:hypothetical protein DKX38_000442 [Salix brachista]
MLNVQDKFLMRPNMRIVGFKPNDFTFATMLKACVGLEFIIAWYAQSEQSEEIIELLCKMRQGLELPNQLTLASLLQAFVSLVKSISHVVKETECKLNKVTFVGIPSACSNAGIFDRGQAYFKSIIENFGMEPCAEHCTCMVWILGRLGRLDKTVKLVKEIPFVPSAMHVLEIELEDEATHAILLNIYANARRWGNVASIRKSMKRKGVRKEQGLSWAVNYGGVHYFSVGDISHLDTMIKGLLEWLDVNARNEDHFSKMLKFVEKFWPLMLSIATVFTKDGFFPLENEVREVWRHHVTLDGKVLDIGILGALLSKSDLLVMFPLPLTVLWLIMDLGLSPKRTIFSDLPLPPLVE